MRRDIYKVVILFIVFFCATGFKAREHIKMATTTSVENAGLLDVLLPVFAQRYGIDVYPITVGTGNAMRLAENGDVDLLLVHCPEKEEEFIKNGHGVERREIFYNYFIIVGPKGDPAKIQSIKEASDAFRKVALGEFTFVSRADSSGTYNKELEIWRQAGVSPSGLWYMETGQGMGATLMMADEKNGYCLVDKGTFLAYKDKIDLITLSKEEPLLKNTYSIMLVNPERYPDIKFKQSKLFADWIGSGEAALLMKSLEKDGEILFYSFK